MKTSKSFFKEINTKKSKPAKIKKNPVVFDSKSNDIYTKLSRDEVKEKLMESMRARMKRGTINDPATSGAYGATVTKLESGLEAEYVGDATAYDTVNGHSIPLSVFRVEKTNTSEKKSFRLYIAVDNDFLDEYDGQFIRTPIGDAEIIEEEIDDKYDLDNYSDEEEEPSRNRYSDYDEGVGISYGRSRRHQHYDYDEYDEDI